MSEAKRLTRHEIQEPDQFLSSMDHVINYITGHRHRVIALVIGAFALAVLVAGGVAWTASRDRAANAALQQLVEMEERPIGASADDTATAPGAPAPFATGTEKDAAVLEASTKFLASHGSGGLARTARMIKAQALVRGGKYADAALLYGEVAGSVPADTLGGAAALAQAAARAGAGEIDPAVEQLTKLAAAGNPYVPKDFALESAAAILETAGRKSEAARLYKRLADEVTDSPLAGAAKAKASELAPSPVTP